MLHNKCHIILHIGTHKTGSTSIQNYLLNHSLQLHNNNLFFLCGPKGKPNFKEIFHAACAPRRRHLLPLRSPGMIKRLWLRFGLKRYLAKQISQHPGDSFILSSELLSLLRQPEEMEKLRQLFPRGSHLKIIVCLREKHDFLASMKRQLTAQTIAFSDQLGRSNYVASDSWLVDYDGLLRAFQQLTHDIEVIDFSLVQKNGGNIVVPFMAAVGVSDTLISGELPYLNRRAPQT